VANGEILQLVSGTIYGKPAAITWFSYNFMMLSFPLVVFPSHVKWGWYGDASYNHHRSDYSKTFWNSIHLWAGTLGVAKAVTICFATSFLLLALNIFMVLGLKCISVSLSNAIFQLQAPLTIVLSVVWLKDRFLAIQGIGMLLSMIGVAAIVLPPLDHENACVKGMWETMLSASIGGIYLTSWRWLETKNGKELSPREGFVDAHMTLSMIGLCNLMTGWPVLMLLHFTGIEIWEWPSSREVWGWLVVNGVVEYLFDASCAMAIFATSPIVVSVTAPLTIPLSMLVDHWLQSNRSMLQLDRYLSVGGLLVVLGTVLIETQPRCWLKSSRGIAKRKREENEEPAIV
jgi:solute carrier family 35 protein F5